MKPAPDGTFHKMTDEAWDSVVKVHLYGGYNVIRAAWPHFREQSYGRIVVATSTSGLFGNFGQANYSAAKLGLVGLINTLAQEGAKYNIKANALAPIAATRMTEDIMPPESWRSSPPEYVAPVVGYLCTEEVPDSLGVHRRRRQGATCGAVPEQGRHLRSCAQRRRGRRELVDDRRPVGTRARRLQAVIRESSCRPRALRTLWAGLHRCS